MSETISVPEIVWTLSSYIGACASLWAAFFFLNRAFQVKRDGLNGGLKWLAWGRFWLRLSLVIGQFVLGMAGYLQMFIPPVNPDVPVTLAAIITGLCIFLGNFFFSACAIGEVFLLNKVTGMPKRRSDFDGSTPVARVGS